MTSSQKLFQITLISGLIAVPILTVFFGCLYFANPDFYFTLTLEDRPVEWLTVILLLLAGVVALAFAVQAYKREGTVHWFFVVFGLLSLFVALEEFSYGQRIFGWETTGLFLRHNDHGETNFHNFIGTYSRYDPREMYAIVVFLYGVLLPFLGQIDRIDAFLDRHHIVVPHKALSIGFMVSAILAFFDKPTGQEEEIAELFLGIYFLLIPVMEFDRMGWNHQEDAEPIASTTGDRVWQWEKLSLKGLALLVAGGAVGWFTWSMGRVWLAPRYAARYLAEPAEVEWFDGAIALVGYETSREDVVAPGDDLTVKLYWQTNQRIPADYWLSVHVLSHPEIASFASYDAPLGAWGGWRNWPTTTWRTGVTMRDVIHLQMPDDLPPDEDFWVVVRIWLPAWDGAPWGSGELVNVTSADRDLFEPFTLTLFDLRSTP
jgi:hypothetical protein